MLWLICILQKRLRILSQQLRAVARAASSLWASIRWVIRRFSITELTVDLGWRSTQLDGLHSKKGLIT